MEVNKVGIIGTGNIFPQYIKHLRQFPFLEVLACTDMRMDIAQERAEEFELLALPMEELMAHPDIDILVNLTIPDAHAQVNLDIIKAGKHVYSEKPLATNLADGRKVLDAANEAGVLVGCAPDTFLGGGLQTCRQLIDDGLIGEPVAATASFASHGMEHWHPNPYFFYQPGAGPVFDMGPYYLTALYQLLGPVKRVSAMTSIPFPERTISSEPLNGQKIPVNVATLNTSTLEFASGAVASVLLSFDIWQHSLPFIEIYGSLGTLSVPDPNTFGGEIRVWLASEGEWREIPLMYSSDVGRGIGAADMAYAVHHGKPHRARGDVAYHVLEIMESFQASYDASSFVTIESQPDRPALLAMKDQEIDFT